MSILLDPVPSLDLKKPARVEVYVPFELLTYFDPSGNEFSPPDHLTFDRQAQFLQLYGDKRIMKVAFSLAEEISIAIFGSTEAVPERFSIGSWGRHDGPYEQITFCLHYRCSVKDRDSAFICAFAESIDKRIVFTTMELVGEEKRQENEIHSA